MASAFCPRCGTPRAGSFRFCRSCGLDFDDVPSSAGPTDKGVPPGATTPTVPPMSDNPAARFGGVAWILCAALTGYLALLQLGAAQTLAALGLDQGDLQTYAAWNGIAAVVTVVFGVRLLQRPTRGTLNWSIAWGILSVIGGVTQIGSGASNDVFIGSIVAAGVAGALSYAARGVAPETKGVEAPSAVRPTALPTPTPVSAPAIPAASLAPPVVAPKSSVADSEVIGANDAIAPINLGVALVFGLLLPLSVSVLPTTPRPTRSLRLAEAA